VTEHTTPAAVIGAGDEGPSASASRCPTRNWKFSANDLAGRQHWDAYQTAYEEALSATSTSWAPWLVVPADHKYALRALVGGIIVDAIDGLDLKPPRLTPAERDALATAKADSLNEPA
jgi:hypothetical protein